MPKIVFEKGENYNIKSDDIIKAITYYNGNRLKARKTNSKNNLKNIVKVSKNKYVDKTTGEIKEYVKKAKRDKNSIIKSMKKLRELIYNNFIGAENEVFITLTYKEVETNYEQVVNDLDKFWKKLKKEFQDIEFIGIIENQENRNSWHLHLLVKDKIHKKIFIPEEEIKRIWGKGIIYISKINNYELKNIMNLECEEYGVECAPAVKDIDRVANYISKIKSKENIPTGKKLYYKSRGIKMPIEEKMEYKEFQNNFLENNEYKLQEEKTILVRDFITKNILNMIKEEIYIRSK